MPTVQPDAKADEFDHLQRQQFAFSQDPRSLDEPELRASRLEGEIHPDRRPVLDHAELHRSGECIATAPLSVAIWWKQTSSNTANSKDPTASCLSFYLPPHSQQVVLGLLRPNRGM